MHCVVIIVFPKLFNLPGSTNLFYVLTMVVVWVVLQVEKVQMCCKNVIIKVYTSVKNKT